MKLPLAQTYKKQQFFNEIKRKTIHEDVEFCWSQDKGNATRGNGSQPHLFVARGVCTTIIYGDLFYFALGFADHSQDREYHTPRDGWDRRSRGFDAGGATERIVGRIKAL
jgi:hypothetical protein